MLAKATRRPKTVTSHHITLESVLPVAACDHQYSGCAGAIASLSLSGGCIMEMRKDGDHRAIYLPPRSLLIMAGASRYEWLHYIPHRKSDVVCGVTVPRSQRRVSFTFRKVRSPPPPLSTRPPAFPEGHLKPNLIPFPYTIATKFSSPPCSIKSSLHSRSRCSMTASRIFVFVTPSPLTISDNLTIYFFPESVNCMPSKEVRIECVGTNTHQPVLSFISKRLDYPGTLFAL